MIASLSRVIDRWKGAFNPYRPETLPQRDGIDPVEISESRTKTRLGQFFALSFVIFLIWASTAPLDAGVHVSGSVVVQGNRKSVQHPQGGLVDTIMVREGDLVQQGQTLLKLNSLALIAELNRLEVDFINALAQESRLNAERTLSADVRWSPALEAFSRYPQYREAKEGQDKVFRSRREDLSSREKIVQEQIQGFKGQIRELQEILKIRRQQLDSLSKDVESSRALADEGYIPKSKANELERTQSDLIASISNTTSEMSKAQSAIAASQLQMSQDRSAFAKEVDAELAAVQKTRQALGAAVEAARFNLQLSEIKAPASGTVVGLTVFTQGGVVKGGETLMQILPKEEKLIIEAKVPPTLIDKVRLGLEADMRFTAFNQNTTPVIPGRVILVGADRLLKGPNDDSTTPPEYYTSQIQTTADGLKLLGNLQIQPGMPVDVIIKTGERTFMSYLLKPILDRWAISFKE